MPGRPDDTEGSIDVPVDMDGRNGDGRSLAGPQGRSSSPEPLAECEELISLDVPTPPDGVVATAAGHSPGEDAEYLQSASMGASDEGVLGGVTVTTVDGSSGPSVLVVVASAGARFSFRTERALDPPTIVSTYNRSSS